MVENKHHNINKIKINVDDIIEKFDCPICMCKLKEPYIAKCGHTFCKVKKFQTNIDLGLYFRMHK